MMFSWILLHVWMIVNALLVVFLEQCAHGISCIVVISFPFLPIARMLPTIVAGANTYDKVLIQLILLFFCSGLKTMRCL